MVRNWETSSEPLGERDRRLRDLGLITGELLHDLAGVVTVVTGRVALAREEALQGRLALDELTRLQSDSEELRRMVTDLLDEMRSAHRSPDIGFPVLSTLEETITRWVQIAPAISVTLRSSLDRSAQVIGPRSFFTRAVGNLLRNGARHARTEVRITLSPSEDGKVLELLVDDDGSGVPPERSQTIFRPFVTEGGTGTGLGLSFARWGAERLGGTLELAGRAAGLGGASFRMTLPIASGKKGKVGWRAWNAPTRTIPPTSPLEGIRVVVVEDDPPVRDVTSRALSRRGAIPVEILPQDFRDPTSLAEVISLAQPDVVILDLMLGHLRGEEVARELRKIDPRVADRTLILTGAGVDSPIEGIPVLDKLTDWPTLITRIRELVASTGKAR